MATLKGPGRIYLQSLPLSRLADRLKSALRRQTGENRGAGGTGHLGRPHQRGQVKACPRRLFVVKKVS